MAHGSGRRQQGSPGAAGTPGTPGTPGAPGTPGTNGKTVWNGTGPPDDALGVNDDFYLDTSHPYMWGPKTGGTWTGFGPTSLVGPAGPAGAGATVSQRFLGMGG